MSGPIVSFEAAAHPWSDEAWAELQAPKTGVPQPAPTWAERVVLVPDQQLDLRWDAGGGDVPTHRLRLHLAGGGGPRDGVLDVSGGQFLTKPQGSLQVDPVHFPPDASGRYCLIASDRDKGDFDDPAAQLALAEVFVIGIFQLRVAFDGDHPKNGAHRDRPELVKSVRYASGFKESSAREVSGRVVSVGSQAASLHRLKESQLRPRGNDYVGQVRPQSNVRYAWHAAWDQPFAVRLTSKWGESVGRDLVVDDLLDPDAKNPRVRHEGGRFPFLPGGWTFVEHTGLLRPVTWAELMLVDLRDPGGPPLATAWLHLRENKELPTIIDFWAEDWTGPVPQGHVFKRWEDLTFSWLLGGDHKLNTLTVTIEVASRAALRGGEIIVDALTLKEDDDSLDEPKAPVALSAEALQQAKTAFPLEDDLVHHFVATARLTNKSGESVAKEFDFSMAGEVETQPFTVDPATSEETEETPAFFLIGDSGYQLLIDPFLTTIVEGTVLTFMVTPVDTHQVTAAIDRLHFSLIRPFTRADGTHEIVDLDDPDIEPGQQGTGCEAWMLAHGQDTTLCDDELVRSGNVTNAGGESDLPFGSWSQAATDYRFEEGSAGGWIFHCELEVGGEVYSVDVDLWVKTLDEAFTAPLQRAISDGLQTPWEAIWAAEKQIELIYDSHMCRVPMGYLEGKAVGEPHVPDLGKRTEALKAQWKAIEMEDTRRFALYEQDLDRVRKLEKYRDGLQALLEQVYPRAEYTVYPCEGVVINDTDRTQPPQPLFLLAVEAIRVGGKAYRDGGGGGLGDTGMGGAPGTGGTRTYEFQFVDWTDPTDGRLAKRAPWGGRSRSRQTALEGAFKAYCSDTRRPGFIRLRTPQLRDWSPTEPALYDLEGHSDGDTDIEDLQFTLDMLALGLTLAALFPSPVSPLLLLAGRGLSALGATLALQERLEEGAPITDTENLIDVATIVSSLLSPIPTGPAASGAKAAISGGKALAKSRWHRLGTFTTRMFGTTADGAPKTWTLIGHTAAKGADTVEGILVGGQMLTDISACIENKQLSGYACTKQLATLAAPALAHKAAHAFSVRMGRQGQRSQGQQAIYEALTVPRDAPVDLDAMLDQHAGSTVPRQGRSKAGGLSFLERVIPPRRRRPRTKAEIENERIRAELELEARRIEEALQEVLDARSQHPTPGEAVRKDFDALEQRIRRSLGDVRQSAKNRPLHSGNHARDLRDALARARGDVNYYEITYPTGKSPVTKRGPDWKKAQERKRQHEAWGVEHGRNYLMQDHATQLAPLKPPFEPLADGFDDLMVDADGGLWIVEYKSATSWLESSTKQMSREWVKSRAERLLKRPSHKRWGEWVLRELRAGRLQGITVRTPVVNGVPVKTPDRVEAQRYAPGPPSAAERGSVPQGSSPVSKGSGWNGATHPKDEYRASKLSDEHEVFRRANGWDVIRHVKPKKDELALRLHPRGEALDHNNAFGQGKLFGPPELHQLVGKDGKPFVSVERLAVWEAHGGRRGFTGTSTQEAARFAVQEIVRTNARRSPEAHIDHLLLDSCNQSDKGWILFGRSNAQRFAEAFRAELQQRGLKPDSVTVLAATEPGPIWGPGDVHSTSTQKDRSGQVVVTKWKPVDQIEPGVRVTTGEVVLLGSLVLVTIEAGVIGYYVWEREQKKEEKQP